MTVLVTVRFAIDPDRLEAVARENMDSLRRIGQRERPWPYFTPFLR